MKKAWYVVRTLVGHENKVKTIIEKRAEERGMFTRGTPKMTDRIFRILIPTEQELRTRSGKKQTITRKVFPGYVLVEMILDDETWSLIRTTPGVTSFVSSGNRPVPLQEKEVEEILHSIEVSKQRPRVAWKRGDTVRVTEGPFADFSGKIEEVNPDREKLRVLISIFGRDTPVELDFTQVEKIT